MPSVIWTTFPVREVGEELLRIQEHTGVSPFKGVDHQGQMTPLQKYVVLETINQREEEKRERAQQAQSQGGGTPTGTPTNAAHGGSKKEQIMKQQAEQAYGANSVTTYKNQEYQGDEDPPLIVGEDEE